MAIIVGTILNLPACKTINWHSLRVYYRNHVPPSERRTYCITAVPFHWSLYRSGSHTLYTKCESFHHFDPCNTCQICRGKDQWIKDEYNKSFFFFSSGRIYFLPNSRRDIPEVVSRCDRVVQVYVQAGKAVLWVTLWEVLIQVTVPLDENTNGPTLTDKNSDPCDYGSCRVNSIHLAA